MVKEVLIACVGKPSAGKSSFLNAGMHLFVWLVWSVFVSKQLTHCNNTPLSVSDATAKVGNYPFTTIKPNHGVSYIPVACPCQKYGKEKQCQPRYEKIKPRNSTAVTSRLSSLGRCNNGTRYVPIQMLDVAGLVPGASEGQVGTS
ncbi:hypothetical protein BC936DRAFT_147545 [Jimgerdemannia flammicorona]|uniref:Uncharacterized protein n=2 Tax=Jimgerdemannia flammicorona TaxID=994334 RepID=A0A433D566_9FUNG|nr:hypothetical protein BC936DRAFT_147545 [Jimgerdemannia flammicorona]RUS28817.1 hypothetical protein BC938DRAFT_481405 [Jimgerdemannia flammicorona]